MSRKQTYSHSKYDLEIKLIELASEKDSQNQYYGQFNSFLVDGLSFLYQRNCKFVSQKGEFS